jgi:selenocysteine lyase/cysteine desulfurase
MALDLASIRAQFPALQRAAVFLDNPAGTQVAQQVIDRIRGYMVESNANADTTKLEQEIDHLVYDLYGLTEEEIKIVEGRQ